MTTEFLYEFISGHKYAVLSTVTADNLPEAAVVGIAITPDLKIIFDTVTGSRKYRNLVHNPSIAFVIGFEGERTVQYEGTAGFPTSAELDELTEIYFRVFPDGKVRKETWKDLVYFVVQPKWIRYSDFTDPQIIEEREY